MHVIGARFADEAAAMAALLAVRSSLPVEPGDVAVRPLGSTRYEEPATGFVLAGRFDSADVDAVAAIVVRHGGTVISRRRETAQPQRPDPFSRSRAARTDERRGRTPTFSR